MAGVVKNMMVRVGADFSGLFGEFKKANARTKSEFAEMGRAAKESTGMGAAFKSISENAVEELETVKQKMNQLTAYSESLKNAFENTTANDAVNGIASGFREEIGKIENELLRLRKREAVLNVQVDMQDADEQLEQLTTWVDLIGEKSPYMAYALNIGLKTPLVLAQGAAKGTQFAFKALFGDLSYIKGPIDTFKSKVKDAASEFKRLGIVGMTAKGAIAVAGAELRTMGTLLSPITKGISGLWNGMKRVTGMYLGFGLITSVVGRLKSVVSEYISENSQLKAQTDQLKASMGQALAPAINLVTNAMSALMPYIIGVSNAIGQLITNLFGSGWTTVADGANNAAEATNNATKAQKEYNRQLMGFDEINKLQDTSGGDSSGTSGSSSQQPSQQPVEGKMPAWITSIADSIRESIAQDDWSILGTEIGTQLEKVFRTADQWLKKIDFGAIGKGVAEGINGAVDVFLKDDAVGIGTVLADGLNAGIHASAEFVKNLDWADLGRLIVKEMSDYLKTIDWSGLAEGLGGLAGGIATAVGQPLVDGIRAIGDYFQSEIEEAGGNIWQGILNGIGKALSAAGSWIKENIFDPFIAGFKETFGIHSPASAPELVEAAENVGLGILEALASPFVAIASWVQDHILTPISNALKGKTVKVGVSADNNTATLWSTITKWWGNKTLKVSTSFSATKSTVTKAWNSIKSWWGTRKVSVATALGTTRTTVAGWWNNVSSWWNNAKKSLSAVAVTAVKGAGWGDMKNWLGGLQKHIGLSVTWTNPSGWIQEAISKYIFNSKGIPKLTFAARGGVVDRATLLGNNIVAGEAGAEMIMPLENNTGYLRILAEQIVAAMDERGGGSSQSININVVLDGKVVGRTAVNYIKNQAIQTGRNPLAAYM